MKRVAENVCFQTIGYLMSGFLKLKVVYFNYDKAVKPGEENYFESGIEELLYEGKRVDFSVWEYPQINKTRVNYIGVNNDVLLIGLDKSEREY